MKPKIGLVTLGVRDLARSVAFYRDGLGWPAPNYKPGDEVAFFPLEGTWLGLFGRADLAKDAGVSAEGSGFSGITLAHNEPSKAEVDQAFAEALAAGATSVTAPEDVFWGGYRGYFADPDGHLWEIAWNPQMDLT
jgi:catechol 2,3-dioxygenase-like lactoylglutathione lyase family enzyme